MGLLGAMWKPSWGHLGPSWGHLGAILRHFEAMSGNPGAILGHIEAILGHLGDSWDRSDSKNIDFPLVV